jgi:hypothetical protein
MVITDTSITCITSITSITSITCIHPYKTHKGDSN